MHAPWHIKSLRLTSCALNNFLPRSITIMAGIHRSVPSNVLFHPRPLSIHGWIGLRCRLADASQGPLGGPMARPLRIPRGRSMGRPMGRPPWDVPLEFPWDVPHGMRPMGIPMGCAPSGMSYRDAQGTTHGMPYRGACRTFHGTSRGTPHRNFYGTSNR